MTEFSITLDIISEEYSLQKISEFLGVAVPRGSIELRSVGEATSAAVFRFDAGTGKDFGALLKRLLSTHESNARQLAYAREQGMQSVVNIAIFASNPMITVGFDTDTIAAIATMNVPMSISYYQCDDGLLHKK